MTKKVINNIKKVGLILAIPAVVSMVPQKVAGQQQYTRASNEKLNNKEVVFNKNGEMEKLTNKLVNIKAEIDSTFYNKYFDKKYFYLVDRLYDKTIAAYAMLAKMNASDGKSAKDFEQEIIRRGEAVGKNFALKPSANYVAEYARFKNTSIESRMAFYDVYFDGLVKKSDTITHQLVVNDMFTIIGEVQSIVNKIAKEKTSVKERNKKMSYYIEKLDYMYKVAKVTNDNLKKYQIVSLDYELNHFIDRILKAKNTMFFAYKNR